MFCSNCGKTLEDNMLFCPFCGSRSELIEVYTPNSGELSFERFNFSMRIHNAAYNVNFITGRTSLTGTVESGTLNVGDQVRLRQNNGAIIIEFKYGVYRVLQLAINNRTVNKIAAGDTATVVIERLENTYPVNLVGHFLFAVEKDNQNRQSSPEMKILEEMAPMISGRGSVGKEAAPSASFNAFYSAPSGPAPGSIPNPQPAPQVNTYANPNPQPGPIGGTYANPNPQTAPPVNTYSNPNPQPGPMGGAYVNPNPVVLEARVGLRTGKGLSAFSAANTGKLKVTPEGADFFMTLGKSAHNHSYSLDQIADTKFNVTHAGIQPILGYTVTLKGGTEYVYTYSPVQKNKMQSIDAILRSKLTH